MRDPTQQVHEKEIGKFSININTCMLKKQNCVREENEKHRLLLTQKKIEKRKISLPAAPCLVGIVRHRDDIHDETKTIEVIDGNHSLSAQKKAFTLTNDYIFETREVLIYENLTSEEALKVGISRNRDAGIALIMQDVEYVTMVRRKYLESPLNKDLRNDQELDTSKAISDAIWNILISSSEKKQIIQEKKKYSYHIMLAKCSNRCFSIIKEQFDAKASIKASRFKCLYGLQHSCLNFFKVTGDWNKFRV